MRFLFVSLVALLLVAASGARAEERYQEWGGGDAKLDALVTRLNELIDAAEKARAADPRLLQDLRAAIAEHTATARVSTSESAPAPDLPPQILVHDDFKDGNFTRNPAWTVAAGSFSIDSGLGLRSVVAEPAAPEEKSDKDLRKELVVDVLGSLLGAKKQEPVQSSQPAQPQRAEIFLAAPISNAFRLVFEIVSREKHGRFSLDIFQGGSRGAGYRLTYAPGGQPAMELQRFGSSGVRSLVARNQALSLEDNFRHRVEIVRDSAGGMTVSLDGGKVLSASDNSFRDPFSGIAVANDGGDYAIREITVFGSR
jgi:hypothetical protein